MVKVTRMDPKRTFASSDYGSSTTPNPLNIWVSYITNAWLHKRFYSLAISVTASVNMLPQMTVSVAAKMLVLKTSCQFTFIRSSL